MAMVMARQKTGLGPGPRPDLKRVAMARMRGGGGGDGVEAWLWRGSLVFHLFGGRPNFQVHALVVVYFFGVRMSEFGSTNIPLSSKHRKLDDRGLSRSVSIDSLDDVLSLESSHTCLYRDELKEDLSGSKSSKFSSKVGSSGYDSVSGDAGSPPFEGLNRPFILPDEWEDLSPLQQFVVMGVLSKDEVAAVVAIKEGKLQLPKLGDKRKFGVDTSSKPFGTITCLKETPSHPLVTPGLLASIKCLRAPGRGKGPLTAPKPPILVNDSTYDMEQVMSIIKEEDIDDCDEYAPGAIGESRLHEFVKIEIYAKEGSTATMISGGSDQEVDGVVEEEKGNDQVVH
nr:hypothetical protein CFP56_06502 [Quercus suber]